MNVGHSKGQQRLIIGRGNKVTLPKPSLGLNS